jgi:hypothetical protein
MMGVIACEVTIVVLSKIIGCLGQHVVIVFGLFVQKASADWMLPMLPNFAVRHEPVGSRTHASLVVLSTFTPEGVILFRVVIPKVLKFSACLQHHY